MRTIIHDLSSDISKLKLNKEDKVVDAKRCKNSCIGCFSCWIKHPKQCCYHDQYSNLVEYIKKSDELILISKCRYGCYSTEVKKVFERCIGYVLPYFTERKGRIHHASRYKNKIKLHVYFYGEINDIDKKCCYNLVKANAINLNTDDFKVEYFNDFKEIKECIH